MWGSNPWTLDQNSHALPNDPTRCPWNPWILNFFLKKLIEYQKSVSTQINLILYILEVSEVCGVLPVTFRGLQILWLHLNQYVEKILIILKWLHMWENYLQHSSLLHRFNYFLLQMICSETTKYSQNLSTVKFLLYKKSHLSLLKCSAALTKKMHTFILFMSWWQITNTFF